MRCSNKSLNDQTIYRLKISRDGQNIQNIYTHLPVTSSKVVQYIHV